MSHHFAPGYEPLIRPLLDHPQVPAASGTLYAIDTEGRIVYFNDGWREFARNNGGDEIETKWGLGANVFDAIPQAMRGYYERLFEQAAVRVGLQPATHCYECSSPLLFREFSMHIYALPERAGYLIANSLVVEQPHDPDTHAPHAPTPHDYRDSHGQVLQCAHCRRVRHARDTSRWDWVPAWVERPPAATSHGMCPTCFGVYRAELLGG